jgi:hypothetical protein
MAVAQEAHAIAIAFVGSADANMVKGAQASAVQGKATPADLAGNLAQGVEGGLVARGEAQDRDVIVARGANQTDTARSRSFGSAHGSILGD